LRKRGAREARIQNQAVDSNREDVMVDVRKVEALDENLLFRFRWFTDPITPWVLQEIAEKGLNEVVAIQLELQKNIYQAKIGAVDKLLAHAKTARK
jgi:hypothetical protein